MSIFSAPPHPLCFATTTLSFPQLSLPSGFGVRPRGGNARSGPLEAPGKAADTTGTKPRGPDSQTWATDRPDQRRRVSSQVRKAGKQAGRGRLRLRQRNIAHGSPHTTLFALSEHTVVRLSKNRLLCFASLVSYKITACKTWIYSDRFIYDPCYKATTQAI